MKICRIRCQAQIIRTKLIKIPTNRVVNLRKFNPANRQWGNITCLERMKYLRAANHKMFLCINMPCNSTKRRWKSQAQKVKISQATLRFMKKAILKLLSKMLARRIPIQIQGVANRATMGRMRSTKRKKASSGKLALLSSSFRSRTRQSLKSSSVSSRRSLRAQL